jgi:hypothetical protein
MLNAEWMAAHPYRETYFETPDDLDMALAELKEEVCRRLQAAFAGVADPDNTVFAVSFQMSA